MLTPEFSHPLTRISNPAVHVPMGTLSFQLSGTRSLYVWNGFAAKELKTDGTRSLHFRG